MDFDEILIAATREGVLQGLRGFQNEKKFDGIRKGRMCVATASKTGHRCKYPAEKGDFCSYHKRIYGITE